SPVRLDLDGARGFTMVLASCFEGGQQCPRSTGSSNPLCTSTTSIVPGSSMVRYCSSNHSSTGTRCVPTTSGDKTYYSCSAAVDRWKRTYCPGRACRTAKFHRTTEVARCTCALRGPRTS